MKVKEEMIKTSREVVEKALIPACERYASNTKLRALIQLLGTPVGGAIDTLLSGEAAKIKAKRFEDFIQYTREVLEKIQEEKIDKKFLKSEEFFSLFQNISN